MRRLTFLVLVAAIALPLAAQTVASLKFAEEYKWAPYTTEAEGLQSQGLSYDLVTELGKRLGLPATVEAYPFERVLAMVKSGERDGITEISRNADRELFLVFSDPVSQKIGRFYALSSKASGASIATFADLKGKTVLQVAGNSYGADFDAAVKTHGIKVEKANDLETSFRMLAAGRADYALAVQAVATATFKQAEFANKFAAVGIPYQTTNYGFALAKASPAAALLPKVNAAIAAMRADGSLARILAKYGL